MRTRLNTHYGRPGRVDREAHIIHGVSVIEAVEALGHGFLIDETTLEQVRDLGNGRPNGLKSRFTHPGLSANGLGKLLGRARNFYKKDRRVLADLHLSESAVASPEGDLRHYVEDLADNDPDMFGMSVVVQGPKVWVMADGKEVDAEGSDFPPKGATTKKPILRVKKLFAVDAVDEPAANRNGLFGDTTNQLAAALFTGLDTWLPRHGYEPEDLPQLITTFFSDDQDSLPASLQKLGRYALSQQTIDKAHALEFAFQYMNARQHRRFISSVNTAVTKEAAMPQENEVTLIEEAADVEAAPVSEQAEANFNAWQTAMTAQFVQAILSQSGLPEVTQQRLARGYYETPEQLTGAIEDSRAELATLSESGVIQMPGGPPRGTITSGDMRTGMDSLAEAVDWLFGVEDAPLPKPALRSSREIYHLATGDVHWYGRFDDESGYALGAANTTTLPGLAVNAMNKVMVQVGSLVELQPYRWYEQVVVVQPTDGSLHDMQWISYGGLTNLSVVSDGGPYTEKTPADSKESDAFVKHGNYVGITRKMLRNSMIAEIRAIPRALMVSAIRTRSANIAEIFTQSSYLGPTLDQDSTALFDSSAHGNHATTAYSISGWKAARLECFKQTELGSGKRQGLWPAFWFGAADLYDQALVDFGYGAGPGGYTGTGDNDVNPYAQSRPGDPRPTPLAIPEFTDTNNWGYLTSPNINPVLQMAYSQNPGGTTHPMPELFTASAELGGLMFSNDTLAVKIRDEYAFGVSGYRGVGIRVVA